MNGLSLNAKRSLAITVAVVAVAIAGLVLILNSGGPSTPDSPTDRVDTAEDAKPTVPAQVLDLTDWKLTLPIGKEQDEADEVEQPKLAHFQNREFFHLNAGGDGVVFRANAGGATTSGSGYPRSELREMKDHGKKEADWSNKSGTHTMTVVQAITATPKVKPEVAAGQIHGDEDVVAMVRLEKKHLFVESDGDEAGDLDNDYKLGTKFTLVMKATPDGVFVTYNGKKTVKIDEVGGGNYFKAGCYTQASDHRQEDDDPDQKYDKPDAYGEVVIYSLKVEHTK
jgi:hypothetical protein